MKKTILVAVAATCVALPLSSALAADAPQVGIGYYCEDNQNRILIDAGFTLTDASHYVDLDGKRPGTYSVKDGKTTFVGGNMAGRVVQMKGNVFTFPSGAHCNPDPGRPK